MTHASRSQGIYLITEPYDGSHVRILASGHTPEAAERQMERERSRRAKRGYTFFSPIRRVIGRKSEIDNMLDRRMNDLPTW
jgi:hypothetical protein